jgi:hypothetical protein
MEGKLYARASLATCSATKMQKTKKSAVPLVPLKKTSDKTIRYFGTCEGDPKEPSGFH